MQRATLSRLTLARYLPSPWRWLLAVAAVGIAVAATPVLVRAGSSYDTIWPANGVLLAILLRVPRRHWLAYVVGGVSVLVALTSSEEDGARVLLLIGLLNAFEVTVAAALLRPRGEPFDMRRRAGLLRFVAYAVVVAPTATALLVQVAFAGDPAHSSFFGWLIPDALGIGTVTPFLFDALSPDFARRLSGRSLWPAIGVLGLVAVVTAIAFGQSDYPLFFICFPALILAAYRFGFAGGAAGALLVAFVSIGFTVHGRGPMMGIADARERVRVMQLFVVTALASSLPFALLLDERRRLERAMAASETEHRLLFEQTAEALFLFPISKAGAPGRFMKVNGAACKYLGYSAQELLALTPTDLQAPENTVPLAGFLATLSRDAPSRAERVHVAKDGRHIPVEIASHLVDIAGETFCLSIVRDVTERRRLEAQLRQAERVETIGQLAGSIAHDFNNVLMAVLGYAQLVEKDVRAGHPVDPDDVSEIRLAAERAAGLTRQLLAFSRPQLGDPHPIDLGALVHETQRFLRQVLGASITLVATKPPEPLFVRADPGQIQQVVLNLVINARDAMPDGGTITLTLEAVDGDGAPDLASGRYALLHVTDTGTGMPPDVLARNLDPFFTTKPPGKGTGIGLATVQRIVTTAKGAVRVESAAGRGTTFRVYLPRVDAPPASASVAPRAETAATARAGTVLLVEETIRSAR